MPSEESIIQIINEGPWSEYWISLLFRLSSIEIEIEIVEIEIVYFYSHHMKLTVLDFRTKNA